VSPASRVLVVAVDGATFDLVTPWVEAGILPTIAGLLDGGVRARTRSTLPALAPTSWTTAATGCNPGQHGIFGFRRARCGGLDSIPVAPADIRRPRVWEIAAQRGRRSIVLGAPLTYPPRGDVGLMVSGFLTPPGADDFVAPAGAAAELRRAVPGYRVDVNAASLRPGRLAALRDDAVEVQSLHAEAAAVLLGREEWDLAWVTFHVLDTVQHLFWRFMDRGHPAWPGPGPFEHLVRDFYVSLDRTLARLLAQRGRETTVVLASAYGAAPLHRYFCLLGWLRDEGFLHQHEEGTLRRGLRRLLPWGGRAGVPARVTPFADVADRIDWSRTRAYAPGGAGGGLWVNLKGREPQGIVEPGRDYEALVAELRRRLIAFRDPTTGEPVVTAVHRREEIYHGPRTLAAPDLILETARTVCAVEGVGPSSLFAADGAAHERSGNHARDGMLVMHGEGLRAGLELCSVPVDDLAPTVLYLMGLPVDPHMDGRVLTEALDAERLARQPVEVGVPHADAWSGGATDGRLEDGRLEDGPLEGGADLHDHLEGRVSA